MTRAEFSKYFIVAATAALIAVAASFGAFFYVARYYPQGIEKLLSPTDGDRNPIALYPDEARVVDVVQKANPAVVAITVSKNVPVYERYFEEVPGPFEDFFGGPGIRIPRLRLKGTELQEVGGGSGFLVSADGYIVTNRHVVADEHAEYTVFTNDGNKYPARVVVRDPARDIAVIKVEGSGFAHLSFGDSDRIAVGQTVVAIGNALAEFRNTVSVGVVSGLSRSITAADRQGGVETLDRLIQTDAAINPGNSGGPLVNLAGEVVGVNVAVAGEAENIGFALSSNSIKNILDGIRSAGSQ